jgi:hypoxanthine phosphoribosyltransferase
MFGLRTPAKPDDDVTAGAGAVTEGERTLFSEDRIAQAVRALARELAALLQPPQLVVPVLAGAFVFAADLQRELAREGLDLETEFVWLRSYGKAERPSEVTVIKPPGPAVAGRRVLLLDGVLESGATLARAHELLVAAGAAAIRSAVAVLKPHPKPLFRADHALFTAGSEFLYGYGMDRAGAGRGLPDIRVRTG